MCKGRVHSTLLSREQTLHTLVTLPALCLTEFYQPGCAWLSGALHGHFGDLYGAFQLGIKNLSVLDKKKKYPMEYQKGDDAWDQYVEALNNLQGLYARKYMSKKWWSQDVVETLLPLHLAWWAANSRLVGRESYST